MFKVVNSKWYSASELHNTDTLEMELNKLESEGWYPIFPIWGGDAIVLQQIVMDAAAQYRNDVEVGEFETEQLREP